MDSDLSGQMPEPDLMTLRDRFAMAALTGMLASDRLSATWAKDTAWAAQKAYAIADAMLAERSKK